MLNNSGIHMIKKLRKRRNVKYIKYISEREERPDEESASAYFCNFAACLHPSPVWYLD
jgi:hypothetical protein